MFPFIFYIVYNVELSEESDHIQLISRILFDTVHKTQLFRFERLKWKKEEEKRCWKKNEKRC